MSTVASIAVIAAAISTLVGAIMNWRLGRLLRERQETLDKWHDALDKRSKLMWEEELRRLGRDQ